MEYVCSKMIARFSKYVFWILGEIVDWYRENPIQNIFQDQKSIDKIKIKILLGTKKKIKKIIEKIEPPPEISKFSKMIFQLFRWFLFWIFLVPFFFLLVNTFLILKKLYGIFSISIQNFPKNPKNILRKPCDHFGACIFHISWKTQKNIIFWHVSLHTGTWLASNSDVSVLRTTSQ